MRARKSEVDAAWLQGVLADPDALLVDHAHCERKAAGTAMALVARYPDHPELVAAMAELAQEELAHFAEVHRHLQQRGLVLGPDPGDPYAAALVKQGRREEPGRLVDRLLVSALIEARSCARLLLLGQHFPEPELRELFARFAKAEANHGHQFLSLARTLGQRVGVARDAVDARFAELEAFERALVDNGPVRAAMH